MMFISNKSMRRIPVKSSKDLYDWMLQFTDISCILNVFTPQFVRTCCWNVSAFSERKTQQMDVNINNILIFELNKSKGFLACKSHRADANALDMVHCP